MAGLRRHRLLPPANWPVRRRAASAYDAVRTDLRGALRVWSRRRTVAGTAVLVLGLGIGSTTSVFSLVKAVALRQMPWPDAERLVAIHGVWPERRNDPAFSHTWNRMALPSNGWEALRREPIFDDTAVWVSGVFYFRPPRSQVLRGLYVSSAFLRLLGVQPIHGRPFSADEDRAPSDAVVIGHHVWLSHFGGRSDILNHAFTLYMSPMNPGRLLKVAGVLPPNVRFNGQPLDVVLPIGHMLWRGDDENPFFRVVAHLAPGVSLRQASAVVEPLVRRLASPYARSARLTLLRHEEIGAFAPSLWAGLIGAGVVLLISCCNVAGLLLQHAYTRRQEFAIRRALGAGTLQVVRQALVEHAVLAGVGAAVGLALASWMTPMLVAAAPRELLSAGPVAVDWWAALWSGLVALMATLAFGAVPTASLVTVKPSATRLSSGSQHTSRLLGPQRRIVALQVALALVLVLSAGLLTEAFLSAAARPLGFDSTKLAVITTEVTEDPGFARWLSTKPQPTNDGSARDEVLSALHSGWAAAATLIDDLRALPGVVLVAGVTSAPFSGHRKSDLIRATGRPENESVRVQMQWVTEQYFDVMGIRILKGRGFRASDRNGGFLAVVSAELERHLFGGHAIGRQFNRDSFVYTIIGVVADVRHDAHPDEDLPTCYALNLGVPPHWVARTAQAAESALPMLRNAVPAAAPYLAVTAATTMEDLAFRSLAEQRFLATLSAGCGTASLAFAAIGVLCLTARAVAERRREIGVRVALGARPDHVRTILLSDATRAMVTGLAVGLPAAYGVSHVLRGVVAGASTPDVRIYLLALAALVSAGMSATCVLAHRASRAESVSALRE